MDFIGRTRELQALERFYQTPEAGLFILYGRRRVGKTTLLTHFSQTHPSGPGFYWMATTHNTAYQLRDFTQALFRYDPRFSRPPAPDFAFADWEDALNHLAEAVAQYPTPQLVVLDEFTYLMRNEPALPSLLQRLWDHTLSKQPNLRLVLTGSLVGMLERELIAYNAPLYGRATALLQLKPLPYPALLALFPKRTADERVAIYAVTGGVPAYLNVFTRSPSFSRALLDYGLVPGSLLLGDPAVMLHEQLKEPQNFMSILSSIAGGFHKWRDIARISDIAETSLGHYLQVLGELGLVERRDPVLAQAEGRKGRYYLSDPFLHFYYRFIVPHLSAIERGFLETTVSQITEELRGFIGTYVFEDLCREYVFAAGALGGLPFDPEQVGSYWQQYRGQGVQLDVVAASPRQKKLLIGEAKWGKEAISRNILTDLIQRSQRMPQVAQGWETHYMLFGREGFTDATQATSRELGVRLVTLVELEETLAAAQTV